MFKPSATAGLLRAILKLNLQTYAGLLALVLAGPTLASPPTTSLGSSPVEFNFTRLINPPEFNLTPHNLQLIKFKSSAEERALSPASGIFFINEDHVDATPSSYLSFKDSSQLTGISTRLVGTISNKPLMAQVDTGLPAKANTQTSWPLGNHKTIAASLNQLLPRQAGLGVHIEDYLSKLRFNTAVNNNFQQLEFKIQHSQTQATQNPYGLKVLDKDTNVKSLNRARQPNALLTRQTKTNIRHSIELNEDAKLTTTAYHNRFQRGWLKDDNTTSLIDRANHGDNQAQAILDGFIANSSAGRQYNQNYNNRGVATKLDLKLGVHQLELGAQLRKDHRDSSRAESDFFSHDTQSNTSDTLLPDANDKQINGAQAQSVYMMNQWRLSNQLGLSFGLRYEDISTSQTRYSEVNQSGHNQTYSQQSDDLLWSGGITYQLNYNTQLLAGVHTEFNPASPNSAEDIEAETSTNYEAGVRFNHGNVSASAIGFFSDYNNTINHCSEAFPCGEQTVGSTTLGESEVKGLELSLDMIAFNKNDISLPISISYTFTEAEITRAQDNTTLNGEAFEYLPENVVNAQLGLELKSGWKSYISASYIDEMCTNGNSCALNQKGDKQNKSEDLLLVDFSSHYLLNPSTQIYLKLDNIFDERATVSRDPDSVLQNRPRTTSVGVKFQF